MTADDEETCPGESRGGSRRRMFYGWVILPIAMVGLIATSPGQTFGVSIFNESIRASLGLSHSQLAAAYMLGTLLAALPIAYIGALMDRYGLRRMLLAAVVLFGVSCFVTSQVSGWASLLCAFFLLRMLGPGALAFLCSNALPFWFDRRLGTVEGVRQLGMAVAMTVIPGLNLWLVHQFGWRTSYMLLGGVVWVVMIPLLAVLFRDRPEDVGQQVDGLTPGTVAPQRPGIRSLVERSFTPGEALRTRSFWIAASGTALFSLVYTAVFFSIVPIFLDRGMTEVHAAGLLTGFAVSLAVMHVVAGALADRFPGHWIMAVGLLLMAAGQGLMCVMSAPWAGQAVGVLMGTAQGTFFGACHPLWARYYGRQHIGKIRGILMTINVGASSVGPFLMAAGRDGFGTFDLPLAASALLPVPVMALSLLATPPAVPRPKPAAAAPENAEAVSAVAA